MTNCFFDEAGYTGRNLLDIDQPVFSLASHIFSDELSEELRAKSFHKVQANELKYSALSRRDNGKQFLLAFFRELLNFKDLIKIAVFHKQFTLLTKLVDLLIEPAMRKDGFDLVDRGGNIAFSNLLFYVVPASEGDAFFVEFLTLFQKMILDQTVESYDRFFDAVLDRNYRNSLAEDVLVPSLCGAKQRVGKEILEISNYTLDVAPTSFVTLVGLWRKQLGNEVDISVIHDTSSSMVREKQMWDRITSSEMPKITFGYDIRTVEFPIVVSNTEAGDSKLVEGIQLADLICGGMTEAASAVIRNDVIGRDKYLEEIIEIFNGDDSFFKHSIWPRLAVDPDSLGTVGENAHDLDEFTRVISDMGNSD